MRTEDRWGVALHAPDEQLVTRFDDAVLELCLMRGQPSSTLDALEEISSQWVMLGVFQSYLALYAQTAEGNLVAEGRLQAIGSSSDGLGERERAHLEAASRWLRGDLLGALHELGTWSERAPRDLLALRVAQDLAFFLGAQDALLEVPRRALSSWEEHERERGLVLGMVAFGLEEKGWFREAEEHARDALDRDPTDPWSTHALAHVMEMEGRSLEGVEFLRSSAPQWSPSFFASHNWWHLALFLLELDEFAGAIELLEGPISAPGSDAWFEIVNQASLLWRLFLVGATNGPPAPGLIRVLKARTDETLSIFNSMHAVAALSLAGDQGAVDDVVAAFRGTGAEALGTNLIEGFAEFGRGHWSESAYLLSEARGSAQDIGGSTAQRDLIDQTLLVALHRSGGSPERIDELVDSHPTRWSPATTARILGRSSPSTSHHEPSVPLTPQDLADGTRQR